MASRVDMHCHSTASQLSRLGVQRSLGLPECATPPEEVYELAKRRGMDFVTITDHDTIEGCLQLADRPDCFVSEELTARFAGEPQAVHVLCYGITPGDHGGCRHTLATSKPAPHILPRRDRLRPGAPVLQRRSAADVTAPPPSRRALPDLGGAQLRRHLGASAVRAARGRSWERAMAQLADGYRRALGTGSPNQLSPTSSVVKVGSADASMQVA